MTAAHSRVTIYKLDLGTFALSTSALNLPHGCTEYGFTADKYNNYYFVNENNQTNVSCYSNNVLEHTIRLKSDVYQLLCLDGSNVTAITANGIVTLNGEYFHNVSSLRPAVPCSYKGDGIVTDSRGIEYQYSNGEIFEKAVETQPVLPNDTSTETNNDVYNIQGEYIYVSLGTTYAKLRDSLGADKENFRVTDVNGKVRTSGKLGTRMTVNYQGKQYCIIVMGDITGEGNVNSRDLYLFMDYFCKTRDLDTVERKATNLFVDNTIDLRDLLALAKMY
ncbi:MAG: hypothetical protein IJC86_03505 [Clostridia bacterium]|nr:hypothetical protein [Clostridia bacterium]